MTFRANVYAQFFFRGAGFKSIAATASYGSFKIFGMNFFFHSLHLNKFLQCLTKKDFIITAQKYQCVNLKINQGENYDAVWLSNSIWGYMLDSSVSLSNSKCTSINPVVFAIKKSKAQELGFVDKVIYTQDIVEQIANGNLKFSMSNPTSTNSGASAYLGMLSTLAGNPEVLTSEILQDENLKENLKTLFTGMERSSGSEDFLEELFLNGEYEAVVTYESSIININKQLVARGEEPLYAVYPVDGVSISDSPFAYIDNKDANKKEIFTDIQAYILSNEGQQLLQEKGKRTWYGGINEDADKTIFNPEWGIDTTQYIAPIKYPSATVIKEALNLYQNQLRKPIHVVFCLDYSGSMSGSGITQLRQAMQYILTEEAANDFIQFSDSDKIDIIPFSGQVQGVWSTENGTDTENLLYNIKVILGIKIGIYYFYLHFFSISVFQGDKI